MAIVELSPILFAYLGGFFTFRGFYAVFPIYMQQVFGFSEAQVVSDWAIITGIALTIGALTRIPAGLISDKIGRKAAITIAFAIYISALLLIWTVQELWSAVVGISLIRMGLNLFAMSGRAVVSVSAREPGLKNGLLSSMVGLGGFLGPWVLSFPLEYDYPEGMLYIAMGVTLLEFSLFIIWLRIAPRMFQRLFPSDAMDLDLDALQKREFSLLLSGFRKHRIKESIMLFLTIGTIFGLVTTIYSIYAYNVLEYSEILIGTLVGVGSIIQAIWAPIIGKIYTKTKQNLRLYSWLLLTLAVCALALTPEFEFMYTLGYLLLNFANPTFIIPEITRMNQTVSKDEFSLIFGTATSLIIFGNAIAGFLSDMIYQWNNLGAFYFAIALGIASSGLIWINDLRS